MLPEEIVTLLQTAPEAGLAHAIAQYGALVKSVIRAKAGSLAAEEDTEELVSDVFLCLYQMRNSIDLSKGSLAALLGSIAQRRAVDFLRKRARRCDLAPEADVGTTLAELPDSNDALGHRSERAWLLAQVTALGEPDAEIIFRKFYLQQTHREIANALSMTENAVGKRCRRGLKKLEANMKGDAFHE